ncbi:MAG: multidrug transporter [Candidatus Accumulibacter sp. 66-26]|nr:efflux transporter outer membrane subunit [Accumulibacter sp.]OJW50096.1 MAG: multidrug transporter [Candidatus Accumulibacter sp. 66-26]
MTDQIPQAFVSPINPKVAALTLAVTLALAGCAQFPSMSKLVRAKPAAAYASAQSLAGQASAWPAERWWQAYGDAQLDALIDEALRDSPDMAAASARLRRAEAYGQIAGAPLLPQVGANASVNSQKLSYNYLTPRSMTPQDWNDYGRVTLDFSWDIDFWGKNRAGLAAATSQLEASRAELAQARLSLAAAVATNYADLAQLFAVRDTAQRSVEVRSKTAQLFAERFANGLETRGSLSEAKARLAAAEGELLLLDEQIGLQRHRLAALLGAGPDRGLAITRPAVKLDREFGLPGELAANLLGRRPDVVAARLMSEAQLQRIDQKKGEFYPNVNLSAFIGVQALGLDLLGKSGSSVGSIGPAISLPIFTGGRLRGELRGTVASYDEAVANYNRTVTQALQEVASAGLSQKALAAQLAKATAAVEAAGEAHRVARNRYEGGLANYLEVLYAEDGLLNSQRHLATLQSRAFSLDVALQRALGGGYQSNTL